jgi:hypothetical protein
MAWSNTFDPYSISTRNATSHSPWLRGVQIHGLDPLRPLSELPLIQPKQLIDISTHTLRTRETKPIQARGVVVIYLDIQPERLTHHAHRTSTAEKIQARGKETAITSVQITQTPRSKQNSTSLAADLAVSRDVRGCSHRGRDLAFAPERHAGHGEGEKGRWR